MKVLPLWTELVSRLLAGEELWLGVYSDRLLGLDGIPLVLVLNGLAGLVVLRQVEARCSAVIAFLFLCMARRLSLSVLDCT